MQLEGGATARIQLEFTLLRVQAGEVDELATPLFKKVDEKDPDSPEILATIARAYIHRFRYKPAHACLNRWIEYQPDNPKPVQWRGWVRERLNNLQAAKADYERALELDPELNDVRLRVVELLLEGKQGPEALPHIERLSRGEPNNVRIRARLGMCRFLQGRFTEARQLMEAATLELPDDAPLLISLANLNIQEGRATEAETILRKLLALDPYDTEALFVLHAALQLQNRSAEATAALAEQKLRRTTLTRIDTLLNEFADSPTATAENFAELGTLLLQIGRAKDGQYWLKKALDKDPGCQTARRAMAEHDDSKRDRTRLQEHRQQLQDSALSPLDSGSNVRP
jgi:tetratricopeptide (TPR) repeat protein